jgi:hypothetical protein
VILARAAAVLLRTAGNAIRQLSKLLITLYDVLIVLPLLAERWVKNARPGALRARRVDLEAGKPS